jgi:hypothetical protein
MTRSFSVPCLKWLLYDQIEVFESIRAHIKTDNETRLFNDIVISLKLNQLTLGNRSDDIAVWPNADFYNSLIQTESDEDLGRPKASNDYHYKLARQGTSKPSKPHVSHSTGHSAVTGIFQLPFGPKVEKVGQQESRRRVQTDTALEKPGQHQDVSDWFGSIVARRSPRRDKSSRNKNSLFTQTVKKNNLNKTKTFLVRRL